MMITSYTDNDDDCIVIIMMIIIIITLMIASYKEDDRLYMMRNFLVTDQPTNKAITGVGLICDVRAVSNSCFIYGPMGFIKVIYISLLTHY